MDKKKYVLVIDEGTTGTKAFIFDKKLNIVAQSYRELTLYSSADGKAEMDGEEIFNKSVDACREAIQLAGIKANEIACMGIANQRSTLLGWRRDNGKPFCKAITWQDTRVSYMKEKITKDGLLEYIRKNCGKYQVTNGIFLIKWMADNVPGFYQSIIEGDLIYGSIDSWLIYRLTGCKCYSTSIDNAALNAMIQSSNLQIPVPLFQYLGLPLSSLPKVVDNSSFYGMCEKSIFGAAIPITGVIADQHAAIYAQRVTKKGDAKCTNGTGSFIDVNMGNEYKVPQESYSMMLGWRMGGKPTYVAESLVLTSGTFQRWIKNVFELSDYKKIDEMAESINDSQGVIVLPTLFGLQHPKIDTSLKAAIMGISESVRKEHIMLATLEGIAFLIRHVSQSMVKDLDLKLNFLKIDGGLSNSNIFCQIVSNIMNIEIRRPKVTDLTALGAAEVAGLHMNLWSEEEFDNLNTLKIFYPEPEAVKKYDKQYQIWKTALERAMNWPT